MTFVTWNVVPERLGHRFELNKDYSFCMDKLSFLADSLSDCHWNM